MKTLRLCHIYLTLLWPSLHNVTIYVNYKWFIDFNTWHYFHFIALWPDSLYTLYWCMPVRLARLVSAVFLHTRTWFTIYSVPGRVTQSVTCLATDPSLTADPGVASSIPARSHTFVEIDHEIISTVILLPSADHSRRVDVSYKRKYLHEVLVNCLFKLAQEKVWLGELTVPQWP